jgi:O-antigen/teichoic acid export membrane protein/GT2 family glycosyltransferase
MSRAVQQTLLALGAGAVVQRMLLFVATICLARTLGPELLGDYAVGLQVSLLLGLASDAGVRLLTAREIVAAESPAAVAAWIHASLRVRLWLAGAAFAVFAPCAIALAADPLFWLLCGAAVFTTVFDQKGIADARGRTGDEVRLETLATAVYVAGIACLWAVEAMTLRALAATYLGSRLVYAVLARRCLPALPREVPAVPVLRMLRTGGVLGATQVCSDLIRSSDLILLRAMLGAEAAGLFAAAQKVALAAEVPVRALSRLLQPHLQHAAARGDASGTLERSLRASAHLVLPIAAGGFVLAEPLVVRLFGHAYADAAWTLRWLLVASVLVGVGSRYGNMLFARRAHRTYVASIGAGLLLNLSLSVALIPAFGPAGTALATVIATAVTSALAARALARTVALTWIRPFAHPVAHAVLVAAVAAAVPAPWGAFAAVAAGGLAFLIGLWVLELRGRRQDVGTGLQRSSGFVQLPHRPTPVPAPEPPTALAERTRATAAECVAVIVNHRSAAHAAACLASLRDHATGVRAVVVDNSEDDREADALRAAAAQLDWLRADVVAVPNRGFGAGCNVGIERALALDPRLRFIWLLNPDTVVTPHALDRLLDAACRFPDAGALGASLRGPDGDSVVFENGRIRAWTLSRSHVAAPTRTAPFETEFITGACLLLGADLARAGLRFDERYFLYVEDMDLCRQIRARGRRLVVEPRAVVLHRGGASQREAPILGDMRPTQLFHMTAGKVRFARKWLPPVQRAAFFAVAAVLKPIVGLGIARSLRFLPVYFGGLRHGLRR